MEVVFSPSEVGGKLRAPASKSAMQRACAAALLHPGKSIIHNPGRSNDDQVALRIIQQLGAAVQDYGTFLEIHSHGAAEIDARPIERLDFGESGLSIRMFTPIAALSSREITIDGQGSLKKRPLHFFNETLPQLGVRVKTESHRIPIILQGPFRPTDITVNGSMSSQYITGLLMAYSAIARTPVSIQVRQAVSTPYIDLTLEMMNHFGLQVPRVAQDYTFYFDGDCAISGEEVEYTVEGDWSNAAFWLVAGAVLRPVQVTGLRLDSVQGDREILEIIKEAGAMVSTENQIISVEPARLRGFEFNAKDCPDLFPPLVALAAYCNGISRIHGVERLKHKESNRAASLQSEFQKLGVSVHIEGNTMLVHGAECLYGADLHAHNDHRIAMALSIAALGAKSQSVLHQAESVSKSYPDFYQDLKLLGANIKIIE